MKYIVPELLDRIKEKYEDDLDKPICTYRLVLQSGDKGSNIHSDKAELVTEYDDLCVRLFDLDVSGWEVMNIKDSTECFDISPNETQWFILVTITLFREL